MKSLPITHKALNSPAKVSMEFLVQNDNQVHKQFQDIGGDYAKGRKEGLAMTQKKGSQRPAQEPTNIEKKAIPTFLLSKAQSPITLSASNKPTIAPPIFPITAKIVLRKPLL